jgi:hypothetical protein
MNEEHLCFDEMRGGSGQSREPYASYHDWIDDEDLEVLWEQSAEAEVFFGGCGHCPGGHRCG